jgi:phospholipid/cholesterol/gamma-HCH transport system substrate-binding protein
MIKQAPSIGRILTMVAFALSCFGILIFLWLSFGGSVPLQPEGYRVTVSFPEATQLAQEAEVRISGVKVGKVRKVEPNEDSGLTDAVIELDARYAPLAKNTHAMLRQKTLLGETYVELAPGSDSSGRVADGGTLQSGQVADTVQLDEILRTFDPETRRRFSTWLDQQGFAARGNGEAISDALGNLTPFAENTDDVLKVLRAQSGATRRLIRNTGEVFSALSERQGQLRELIRNSNRVWEATASRDANLADTFRALPTFLREGRTTTTRLSRFAEDTNPLIDQLRPAARQLSPALADLDKLAPDLRGLFRNFKPLVRVSREGLPATSEALDNTRPFLGRLDSFLRNFTPIIDYLGLYKREIAAFFANDSAVTQAKDGDRPRYLRTQNPVNPEIMAAYPNRIATNRSNPYPQPGGAGDLATYLKVFGSYLCTSNTVPALPPGTGPGGTFPDPIRAVLDYYAYGGTKNRGAAPPCTPQSPLGPQTNGGTGLFPRLQPLP